MIVKAFLEGESTGDTTLNHPGREGADVRKPFIFSHDSPRIAPTGFHVLCIPSIAHGFSQFLGNRCRSPQDTPCSTCCRGHAGHTNGTHRTCHARTAPELLPAWRHGQGRLPLHAPVHSRRHALAMEYRCTEDGYTLILVSYSYETRMKLQNHEFRVSYEFHMSMIRV